MGLLDGLFGNAQKQGQNAFKNVIMTGASASKNETVQSVARQMTPQPSPSNQPRPSQPRPIATPINTEKKTPPRVFNPIDVPIAAAKVIIGATPFGVAHQAMKLAPNPPAQVQKPQTTPLDGALAVTKPLYEWGQGASQWWTQNAAPVIEKAIDTVPYLGPAKVPSLESRTLVTASPLTNGGTRLTPNWESDVGHDALKGAASDLPKHSVEFVATTPAALSWLGQEVYKDPVAAATKVGGGALLVYGGMSAAAAENPARFAGEMAGGILIGGKTAALKQRIGVTGLRGVAHLDPWFERGMKVYTGKPGPLDAITRWQNPFEYHPTLKGSTKFELDPAVFDAPRNFYHGASRNPDFTFSREPIRVGSADPLALPETRAASLKTSKGIIGKPEKHAVEHALFFGPPDTGYSPFSSGAFLKVRAPVRDIPAGLKDLAKTYENLQGTNQPVPKSLKHELELRAYDEYFQAPRGEMLVSPKPIGGYKWKGIPEQEYIMKPGTDLYPVFSGRTRLWARFGITKGSSYTLHPQTGKVLEIQEFSTRPVHNAPLPDVWIDIPAISEKLPKLPEGVIGQAILAETTTSGKSKKDVFSLDRAMEGPSRPPTPRRDDPSSPLDYPSRNLDRVMEDPSRPPTPRRDDPSSPLDYPSRNLDRVMEDPSHPSTPRPDTSRPPRNDRPRTDTPNPERTDSPRPNIPKSEDPMIVLLSPPQAPIVPRPPQHTDRKSRKPKKKRDRDPYDWIVGNPVHGIDSFFGLGEAPRQKKKPKNAAPPFPPGILSAPTPTKKGKPLRARRDPLAAPGKDFFEVKF
jgi:hypothetical protein